MFCMERVMQNSDVQPVDAQIDIEICHKFKVLRVQNKNYDQARALQLYLQAVDNTRVYDLAEYTSSAANPDKFIQGQITPNRLAKMKIKYSFATKNKFLNPNTQKPIIGHTNDDDVSTDIFDQCNTQHCMDT